MIYSFEGRTPRIGAGTYVAPSAEIIGDVTIGERCYIGHGAIIRGDYGSIQIGDGTAVEEAVVIHAPPDGLVQIGSHVTMGHCACVHGRLVKDWAVIGMNAVVSIGAEVGEWTIVAEGAVVKQNGSVPDNTVCTGAPAKPVRELLPRDKESWVFNKHNYERLAGRYLAGGMVALS